MGTECPFHPHPIPLPSRERADSAVGIPAHRAVAKNGHRATASSRHAKLTKWHYFPRRRRASSPTPPNASNAIVAGSGTPLSVKLSTLVSMFL